MQTETLQVVKDGKRHWDDLATKLEDDQAPENLVTENLATEAKNFIHSCWDSIFRANASLASAEKRAAANGVILIRKKLGDEIQEVKSRLDL